MSRATLPGHRSRWRAAAAGLVIATLSFSTAACGDGDGAVRVVDDGGGSEENEEDGGEDLEDDGGEQGDDD